MSTNRYDVTLQNNTEIRTAAKLLYISSAKDSGDWHSALHSHNCSEFFYVTSGIGQFRIDGNIYPVSVHDLVIINPNVLHTEVSSTDQPLEYIALGIDGLELTTKENNESRHYIVNFQNSRENILIYLQNMLKEVERKSPGYEIVCQDLMEILMIQLMRQTNFSASISPIRKKSTHLCSTIHKYIETHYKENITLDLLADLTHISKYYMVHAFTEEYGISPINYMIYCRIEEGKQLLKNDDYSISLISRLLGFSSPSYFSQAFKKLTGQSPNEYRKCSRSISLK